MIYPTEVDINEKNIEKLTATFKGAYKQIVSEINRATDWGVQNRKALLRQIEGILQDLSVDVDEFVKNELPTYYEQGFKQGIKQLENIDAEVVSYSFNKIHKEAIEALVSDTAKAFGESMTGVARSADLLINKATREGIVQKMAQGQIGGKALKEVRDQIKGQLAQQGLSALTDKGGRKWELDRYAEMLFRTKAVEARNTALRNLMAENDYDLVQVSSHGGCDLCKQWEGKILSATGATKGYPTVADAEAGGLFHPQCRHVINVLIPSLAKQTRAYNPNEDTLLIDQPATLTPEKVQERTKSVTIYRATGSDFGKGEATLGDGFYFAFDKSNVKKYGDKLTSYTLPKDVKMLDLSSAYDLSKFTEEAIAENRGVYMAYLDKGDINGGMGEVMRRQALKKGYDGIIGDDSAFGSVVFNEHLLTKKGK